MSLTRRPVLTLIAASAGGSSGGYGVPYLYSRTTQLIAGFINLELPCARP